MATTDKIRPLDQIKTMEDYHYWREQLDYYLEEYDTFSNKDTKTSAMDVYEQFQSTKANLAIENSENEKLMNILANKYERIKNGTYESDVKNNINAIVLMLERFEASNQKMGFAQVLKGILTGDQEVIEYLKKKYNFTLANMYGIVAAPEALDIQSSESILDYMAKTYNFVDIDVSEISKKTEEKSLIVYQEPVIGTRLRVAKEIEDNFQKVLQEYRENKEPGKEQNETTQKAPNIYIPREKENNISKQNDKTNEMER